MPYPVAAVRGKSPVFPVSDYLLRDEFTTARAAGSVNGTPCEPGPGTRLLADTAGSVTIADGKLVAGDGTGGYNDPALWSAAQVRADVGALSAVLRPTGTAGGSNDIAGMLLIDPSNAPANPLLTSMGLYQWTPRWRIPQLGTSVPNGATTRLRCIDYLGAVIPRPSGGAWVAVSGGIYGTFPSATLLWVYDTGSDDPIYVSLQNHIGAAYYDLWTVLKASKLAAAYTTRYGAALAADTFTRADGALGNTEVGNLAWTQTLNQFSIGSGKLVHSHGTGLKFCLVTTPTVARIIEWTIRTPAAGYFETDVVFRYANSSNHFACRLDSTVPSYTIYKVVGGSLTTLSTGAAAFAANTTYRLVVVDTGSVIRFYANNTDIVGVDVADSALNTNCGVGLLINIDDDGTTWDNFAAWPGTVTLPTELGPFPSIPNGTGAATISDAFTAADGTDLTTYNADWVQASNTWEVRNNKAQMTAAAQEGFAVRETGMTNMEVSAAITTPATTDTYPIDWYCSVIARYTDATHFLQARFLYQDNSPEVELVENNGAGANVVCMVALGANALAVSTAYTLRLAVVGAEIAVYLDGEQVIRHVATLLTGTKAGIAAYGATQVGQPAWDDFAVKAAV